MATLPDGNLTDHTDTAVIFGNVYAFLTAIMSSLSILGCSVIFFTYAAYKDLRTPGRRLLVNLCVADMLTATGNILGIIWSLHQKSLRSPGCILHSSLTSFSSIASFLWNDCMAVFLYVCLVHGEPGRAARYAFIMGWFAWCIPVVVISSGLGLGVFGPGEETPYPSWCWIDTSLGWPATFGYQLYCGKIWEIVSYIIVLILYGKIIIHQRKANNKDDIASLGCRPSCCCCYHVKSGDTYSFRTPIVQDGNRALVFVPVVFICLRIWGTLRFLLDTLGLFVQVGSWTAFLVPLQGIGDSGQGFANAVLYCVLVANVRNRLLTTSILHCCRKKTSADKTADDIVDFSGSGDTSQMGLQKVSMKRSTVAPLVNKPQSEQRV